jgi:hypothetical protein
MQTRLVDDAAEFQGRRGSNYAPVGHCINNERSDQRISGRYSCRASRAHRASVLRVQLGPIADFHTRDDAKLALPL